MTREVNYPNTPTTLKLRYYIAVTDVIKNEVGGASNRISPEGD